MKPLRAPASLRPWYWAGVGGFFLYELATARADSGALLLAGNAVAVLSLVPAGLWCLGRVYGLPLFPLLALGYLPTFALPLISPTAEVAAYRVETRLAAALAVVVFLGVATLVWYPQASRPSAPRSYWGFRGRGRSHLFLALLWVGDLWLVLNAAGWLPDMSFAAYSAVRNATQGLATLSAAVLAYRWGGRRLPAGAVTQFAVAMGVFLVMSAAGLLLVYSLSMFAVVAAMFALGRGRVPVWALLTAAAVFSVLHAGKHQMRAEYWVNRTALHPAEVPEYYAEWVGYGLGNLTAGDERAKKTTSLTDRASVLQMLLLVTDKSPAEKPFLYGQTYALIPELMIPRFLVDHKAVSHEGTYMLSVYYGLQTREATRTTTIGFGHLPEAYANFGWPGVLGLGVFVGLTLGAVTRWSAGVPLDSFRGLFALYVLSLSIQTEHTMGVTAASLSQGTLLLLGLGWALMETKSEPAAAAPAQADKP